MQVNAKNLGHRLGSDHLTSLPENSSAVFERSISRTNSEIPLVINKKFLYAEFDVQETLDGELVVFHDKYIIRMIPNIGDNIELYKDIIKKIKKRTGKKYSPEKLKVKLLTLTGRDNLINLIANYYFKYGKNPDLIFEKKFNKSFPTKDLKKTYCNKIQELGLIGIFKAGPHKTNLCDYKKDIL